MTKITIEGDDLTGTEIDGDWQVTFWLDDYLVRTGVYAQSGEQAIRFAEDKLGHLDFQDVEEITATLCGTIGGN